MRTTLVSGGWMFAKKPGSTTALLKRVHQAVLLHDPKTKATALACLAPAKRPLVGPAPNKFVGLAPTGAAIKKAKKEVCA